MNIHGTAGLAVQLLADFRSIFQEPTVLEEEHISSDKILVLADEEFVRARHAREERLKARALEFTICGHSYNMLMITLEWRRHGKGVGKAGA